MAKQFVLTYSGKNEDIQDWIEDLKNNPSVNTTEAVCNAIRFYLKHKDTVLKKPSLDDFSFSLDDINRLKDLFIIAPSTIVPITSTSHITNEKVHYEAKSQEEVINDDSDEISILDIIDDEDEY